MKLSFKNYWQPTPEKIQKISEFVELTLSIIAASSLVAHSPNLAAWLLIGAGITNKFFKLFS